MRSKTVPLSVCCQSFAVSIRLLMDNALEASSGVRFMFIAIVSIRLLMDNALEVEF